jgi:ribosome maturation factor RimP
MRTKQLRLNDSDQIRRRMAEFIGKKINIVLSDRTVMFGELMKANDDAIVLKNMRLENVTYPFQTIVEVYLDTRV